jgi:hypothetical protein
MLIHIYVYEEEDTCHMRRRILVDAHLVCLSIYMYMRRRIHVI